MYNGCGEKQHCKTVWGGNYPHLRHLGGGQWRIHEGSRAGNPLREGEQGVRQADRRARF